MTYEALLKVADDEQVDVYEMTFPDGIKGLYGDSNIAINKNLETSTEKACILAEELGHYYTSTGNILNFDDIRSRKQELQARLWAYNKQIGLLGIIRAYEARCKDKSEMAEYLEVTEEFLSEALKCYKNKYGIYAKLDNYIIYFEPSLYVMKLM